MLQHVGLTVLYCTITLEKAVKPIVASTIGLWPHRDIQFIFQLLHEHVDWKEICLENNFAC